MYRDILRGKDKPSLAAQRVASAHADVVLLLGFDYDFHLLALRAFADQIVQVGGPKYSDLFALKPNTGLPTDRDMDGDGKTGMARDAQGYGRFTGVGGMAILSRYPIDRENVQDFSGRLWANFAWAGLPRVDGQLFPNDTVFQVQRLSTTGHWIVPITAPNGQALSIGAYHATPPVFDGPEDRNGLRNADETRFWVEYLDQHPNEQLIILGGANLDPLRGEGRRQAMHALLAHKAISDPFPPDTYTVDWSDLGLGKMRVDYILSPRNWAITGQGTIWPQIPSEDESRHALIWVDLVPSSAPVLETLVPSQ